MDNAIWSRRFAEDVARVLGYPMPEAAPDGGDEMLRQEGDRLVAEITETFRYLPLEQVNWACNLAAFLRAREIEGRGELRPPGWPVLKLREVRDYASFLRGRYGADHPADESDEWTEEDERDLTVATWRRLDEEDPWPEGRSAV